MNNENILMYMLNGGPRALEETEEFAHKLIQMVPQEIYLACICMLIDIGVEQYQYDPIEIANAIAESVKEVNTELGGMYPC